VEQDATLVRDLERLIEPLSRGDPESPLRWTCKSVRKLAQELGRRGHRVSHRLVAELLHEFLWPKANPPTKHRTSSSATSKIPIYFVLSITFVCSNC
jgi:hypothetical protein